MYIPRTNLITDKNEILAFMRNHSFATVITATQEQPTASHLPITIYEREENIILSSHFSRANKQWTSIEGSNNLVIFNGPHAYISPANYTSSPNVPTWNYIAVHAYGYGKIITEPEQIMKALDKMVDNFESAYRNQWDNFPEEYKTKMAKGIVAFEITVTNLQAKKKLSQNRSNVEMKNIIDSLSESMDSNERSIAEYMKKNSQLAG